MGREQKGGRMGEFRSLARERLLRRLVEFQMLQSFFLQIILFQLQHELQYEKIQKTVQKEMTCVTNKKQTNNGKK